MTNEQIRIVIAEACGKVVAGGHSALAQVINENIPNYPLDLNACHEMEKVLMDGNGYNQYPEELYQVVYKGVIDQPLDLHFSICHATSQQRCEAFIKTVCPEKWID